MKSNTTTMMLALHDDINLIICGNLPDRSKLSFTSASKQFHPTKYKTLYTELYDCAKICAVPYFDRFTNVYVTYEHKKLPRSITHLHFDTEERESIEIPQTVTHLSFCAIFYDDMSGQIPNSVTHLSIADSFVKPKRGIIPNSVTHLYLEYNEMDNYYEFIYDIIPDSVTHLTFNNSFDDSIDRGIPSTVTHLVFGKYFNMSIDGNIPSSVIHVTFGKYFNQSINSLPTTVKEVVLNGRYNMEIDECVESRTRIIIVEEDENIYGWW